MNDSIGFAFLTTTPLEMVSFLLAFITVLLNIRQNHWAWLFAILASGLYGVVFYGARLYGDAALQLMFIVISGWGWYQWRHGGKQAGVLRVSVMQLKGRARTISAWLVAYLVFAWFLWRFTDTDVPRMDGFLTAGSVIGQILLSRKKLENWLVWIAVDVLYVGLYVYKGLLLTAVLYAMFTLMAWMGYQAWKKAL